MSTTGTHLDAAQRLVQHLTEERILQAEQSRLAQTLRRVRSDHDGPAPRRARRGLPFAWTLRRRVPA